MHGKLVEVADGVYAYIQGRGEWFVNNAGLIVGEEFSVVVDSVCNEQRAKEMISQFREVTAKDFRILINTHGHPDHVWTNHLFDAVAVAHEMGRQETLMAFVEIYQSLFPDLDFSGAKITPQNITFESRMKLYNDAEMQIIHPGVAHTRGDCYIYIPQKKVVFCGDLLFAKPCTPLAVGGSVRGSVNALRELLNLDAKIYVPGHGGLAGEEHLVEAIEYFEFVWEEAKKRHERGMGWYEAAMDIDLGEYAKWSEAERIVGNVARAYAEIEGRELEFAELVEVARKMLEYGGGRK
ncbi:MBL fold metallo-hydrolase [Archaeoglobus fulgidus]|jgi:glyoxylase-like metal-dependent hydrolase (beta-lactamase superfamily II)|uniref:Dehydrase n=2 Tax=Archaeoglobus fulgidus TaxID=2234 RepID=O30146_ARCFU|nr:MBL fold metallo-hydrolase [Archaeoglobus fulgidus]AAB91139.1 dehydrase [Archaeoglobus fulgidus DSM 4304]AIG96929.1 Zn-dependent hydrolase [Archaeoglobus fulgidus DSM 8774]